MTSKLAKELVRPLWCTRPLKLLKVKSYFGLAHDLRDSLLSHGGGMWRTAGFTSRIMSRRAAEGVRGQRLERTNSQSCVIVVWSFARNSDIQENLCKHPVVIRYRNVCHTRTYERTIWQGQRCAVCVYHVHLGLVNILWNLKRRYKHNHLKHTHTQRWKR